MKKRRKQTDSIADRYFGAFKVTHWPEDLEEFTVETMKKLWK